MSARPPIVFFRQLRDLISQNSDDPNQDMGINEWERLVNPVDNSISVFLPKSTGSRSMKRVKRIDTVENDNIVSIIPVTGDLIDDSAEVVLTDPWSEVWLIDALPGFWDNTGATFPNGLPNGGTTGQIIAKASNEDNDFIWVDPPSGTFTPVGVRPATMNELIAAGVSMGFWP